MGMIKCPECGKEISDMAQSCPNCGRPLYQQNQQNQKNTQNMVNSPRVKKKSNGCLIAVLCSIGIIVLIGIVAGTSGKKTDNSENGTSQKESQEEQEEQNTQGEGKSNKNVAMGEEGEIGKSLLLKVNEVTETESISAANGMLSYKPKSGKYVVINVTISNESKNSQRLLLNYFKLVGPDEAKYVSTIITGADENFITIDTVNPNLSITGNLVFEIPTELSAQDCVLKYNDLDIFSSTSFFDLK